MPVPSEYQQASHDFERFLNDARDALGLVTTHQTYTVVQAVFQVFRRRLSIAEAILFAGVLPPILRAIFVADWDPSEPRRPFADLDTLNHEVLALRPLHNCAPNTAIQDVAVAIRKNVVVAQFEAVLAGLPAAAREFWRV